MSFKETFTVKDDQHSEVRVLFGDHPRATICVNSKLQGEAAFATIEAADWIALRDKLDEHFANLVIWKGAVMESKEDFYDALLNATDDEVVELRHLARVFHFTPKTA